MRPRQLLVGAWLLWTLLPPVWSARILFVFPYEMHSQCKLLTPYLNALLDRGHELTVIHAFSDCQALQRTHSIYIENRYDSTYGLKLEELWLMPDKWTEVQSIRKFMMQICLNVLESERVQELMRSKVSYDLMVLEPSHSDALFGMAAHFNATLIGLATCGGDWNMDTLVGFTTGTTFEPLLPMANRRGSTLLDRFNEWMHISEEWLMHKLIFLPGLRSVHEHFFGHLSQSFIELRESFSLILLNQHFSLFGARPNVPSLVEVAGMHVPKKMPVLPAKLAQFIDGAQHGVILMVLGTEMHSKDLSTETLAIILDTFAALPQRVIWKFEGDARPNASSNVYMNEWVPQQAILAHPNVRLFISHGGILGIIEATYYAKPVLGMPLFFDQFRNVERMQVEGAAEIVDILKLSRQSFESVVRQLLDQPQYQHNVLALSQRFRDKPMHPLDTAIYWTEYIIRHKGAPHMRILPSNIKLVDYYCLDNVLMIVVRFGFVICLVLYLLCKLLKCLERRSIAFQLFNFDLIADIDVTN
ncbi:hypothetical protein KR222_010007 [Zaprionus bogoriensis]|nr:hypothetical protein KR222_010007 [Zaprionus bogoriensis]